MSSKKKVAVAAEPTEFELSVKKLREGASGTGATKNVRAKKIPRTESDDDVVPVATLLHEKSRRVRYFLDSQKHPTKCWMTMIDVASTNSGCLPTSTGKPCWWCRHSFTSAPIGVPIAYTPHRESGPERERFERFLLSANLVTKKELADARTKTATSRSGKEKSIATNDIFETEGIFCSFPCAKAYILKELSCAAGGARYKDSLGFLSLMFAKVSGDPDAVPVEIPTAPSWKVLKEYGGHLTVQEFRSVFGSGLIYEPTVNVSRPYMFSSSQYVTEKKA